MMAGYTPYFDENPMLTFKHIMKGELIFPSHFTNSAKSLLKKLLQERPTKRLGVVKGGARVIKKHQWFQGFDFSGLVEKRLVPPHICPIAGDNDISNFPECRKIALSKEEYVPVAEEEEDFLENF